MKFYSDNGTACLRMYNIDNGKINWRNIKRMILTEKEIKEYLLQPNDILINRVNSRELVGKAAIISDGIEPCVFESKNIRLRLLYPLIHPSYIIFRFLSAGHQYFNTNAQQVVGMASVSQIQIGAFSIPLPPLAEQRRIVAEVERRLSVVEALEASVADSLKRAARLRQAILKRAFSGRLVPQDPADEPASALLARIRAERARAEAAGKGARRGGRRGRPPGSRDGAGGGAQAAAGVRGGDAVHRGTRVRVQRGGDAVGVGAEDNFHQRKTKGG